MSIFNVREALGAERLSFDFLSDVVSAETASTSQPNFAAVFEGSDASGTISTDATMSVGDTFSGTLSPTGDTDWIAIDLTEGQAVTIAMTGNSLDDPLVRLYDANGVLMGQNDDIDGAGGNFNSSLYFTAPATGTYYIEANSYNNSRSGTYEVAVTSARALPTFTNDQIADYLTDGFWEDNGGGQRAFTLGASRTLEVYFEPGYSAEGLALARAALDVWSDVTGITFVEVNSSVGADIRFQESDPDGAYSTSSVAGSTIFSSLVNVPTNWLDNSGTTIDSYSFQTYIHEIGHALGLGHGGDYNGSATYGIDTHYANDSWQASVMSYISQLENTAVGASLAFTITPMIADILAIQELYGTSTSTRTGDTTYGYNSTAGGVLDNFVSYDDTVAMTVYDDGGTDTFDFSGSSADQTINLVAETHSDVNGLVGNLSIARGVQIENAIGGSGNDVLNGNAVANDLDGSGGNDALDGAAGNDTLRGGAGSDTLTGGLGEDSFVLGGTLTDVTDFEVGVDSLDHSELGMTEEELIAALLAATDDGTDTTIDYNGSTVILRGITTDQLEDVTGLSFRGTEVAVSVVGRGGNALSGLSLTFTPDGGGSAVPGTVGGTAGVYDFSLEDGLGTISGGRAHDTALGDDPVTSLDVLEVLRIASGLGPTWGTADTFDLIASDLDHDGQITALDALALLRYAAGLDTPDAPEWVLVDPDLINTPADITNVPTDFGVDIDASGRLDVDAVAILVGDLTDFG